MPRKKRVERCVFKEGGSRCIRNGAGTPPLCRPHQIAFAEQARRAEDPGPRGAARRAAEGVRDIVEDLLNGRGFDSKKAATTVADFAWGMGGGYGAFHPDIGEPPPTSHFDPPQDFRPPPNWGQREPIRPQRDPAIEHAARRELGFGPADPLTEDAIKERRRQLARRHHPDRGGSVAKMQAINDATDALLGTLS